MYPCPYFEVNKDCLNSDVLHHCISPFDKLYNSLLIHYSPLEQWSHKFCKSKRYHGGTFTRGDCKRLLENNNDIERLSVG